MRRNKILRLRLRLRLRLWLLRTSYQFSTGIPSAGGCATITDGCSTDPLRRRASVVLAAAATTTALAALHKGVDAAGNLLANFRTVHVWRLSLEQPRVWLLWCPRLDLKFEQVINDTPLFDALVAPPADFGMRRLQARGARSTAQHSSRGIDRLSLLRWLACTAGRGRRGGQLTPRGVVSGSALRSSSPFSITTSVAAICLLPSSHYACRRSKKQYSSGGGSTTTKTNRAFIEHERSTSS